MKRTAIALAFALLAGSASASVLINFEGVGVGASVNDYYNGGADSLGNSGGPNYGINFAGWKVSVDSHGNRYAAGSTFTFAQRSDINKLVLDSVGIDPFGDAMSYALNGSNNRVDAHIFPGVLPFLQPGGTFTFASVEDSVRANTWNIGQLTLTGFEMNLRYMDNLFIDAPNWVAAASLPAPSGTVPEPATLALLGLGALGMIRRRKQA